MSFSDPLPRDLESMIDSIQDTSTLVWLRAMLNVNEELYQLKEGFTTHQLVQLPNCVAFPILTMPTDTKQWSLLVISDFVHKY